MKNFHIEYQIAQLISKELVDELTFDESKILQKWLGESEDNKKLYELIKTGKNKKLRDEFIAHVNTDNAWQKVSRHIEPKIHKIDWWKWFSRVAAILIVGLLAGTIYWLTKPENIEPLAEVKIRPGSSKATLLFDNGKTLQLEKEENDSIVETDGTLISNKKGQLAYTSLRTNEGGVIFHTVIVPKGGEYKLVLTDGTKVWLNSESEIKYPVQFTKNKRKVWINGEVHFDVQKDKTKPFIVGVNDVEVEVLGTKFNIEAYRDKSTITTTLIEGSVKLTKAQNSIIIEPNQQVITSKGNDSLVIKNVDAENYALWTEGYFFFEAEDLSSIMEKLARWYNVNIFYKDKSIMNRRFTAEVKRYEDIDKVLKILSATNKVNFKINSNNITVFAKKRQ